MLSDCRAEHFAADHEQDRAVDDGDQRPGDRIRYHQVFHGPMQREDPEHPLSPHSTGEEQPGIQFQSNAPFGGFTQCIQ